MQHGLAQQRHIAAYAASHADTARMEHALRCLDAVMQELRCAVRACMLRDMDNNMPHGATTTCRGMLCDPHWKLYRCVDVRMQSSASTAQTLVSMKGAWLQPQQCLHRTCWAGLVSMQHVSITSEQSRLAKKSHILCAVIRTPQGAPTCMHACSAGGGGEGGGSQFLTAIQTQSGAATGCTAPKKPVHRWAIKCTPGGVNQ